MSTKVGMIVTDLMTGDAVFQIVSEKDFNIIANWEGDPQDVDGYEEFIFQYFWDEDKDDHNEKILMEIYTQTYVTERKDLSEYEIIGILTLPGG